MEEISKRLYRQLDSSGYSRKMIRIRRNMSRKLAALWGRHCRMKVIISGSRGEGVAKSCESDADILGFIPAAVCITNQEQFDIDGFQYMFLAINICPGHCKLELVKRGVNIGVLIENALVPFNGKWYLSSEAFMAEIKRDVPSEARTSQMTGPAQTLTDEWGGMFDTVFTVTCDCRTVLTRWALRPRRYDWLPPWVRLHAALTMNGNLVATGTDASPTNHLEWRYCFNEIELLLMEYLNDTQHKLFKVLKIINTDILKPAGLSITSYMMKNVVFWLAESYHQTMFVPETLFQWVLEALKMLKHAVEINKLQYYMIPERNLITEKVRETDRVQLQMKLSELLDSGPALLLQCKTLHRVMTLTIPELILLQHKMELFEMCRIYFRHRYLSLRAEIDKDATLNDSLLCHLFAYMIYRVLYGWPCIIQQEIDKCNDLNEAVNLLLR